MKNIVIAATVLAISLSSVAFADSPLPGHNNAEMFSHIDQNANAANLNKMAPAAGGNQAEACKADSASFCKGIAGDAKIASCLKTHQSALSKPCASTIK